MKPQPRNFYRKVYSDLARGWMFFQTKDEYNAYLRYVKDRGYVLSTHERVGREQLIRGFGFVR